LIKAERAPPKAGHNSSGLGRSQKQAVGHFLFKYQPEG
jgi:hypothetical protein